MTGKTYYKIYIQFHNNKCTINKKDVVEEDKNNNLYGLNEFIINNTKLTLPHIQTYEDFINEFSICLYKEQLTQFCFDNTQEREKCFIMLSKYVKHYNLEKELNED